jgi:hypothetical protein
MFEEIKKHLESIGFRIYKDNSREYNMQKWYACREIKGAAFCHCNRKPPPLVVRPYDVTFNNGVHIQQVEFELRAEYKGIWFNFQAYAVLAEDAIKILPKAERALKKAWNTIAR